MQHTIVCWSSTGLSCSNRPFDALAKSSILVMSLLDKVSKVMLLTSNLQTQMGVYEMVRSVPTHLLDCSGIEVYDDCEYS